MRLCERGGFLIEVNRETRHAERNLQPCCWVSDQRPDSAYLGRLLGYAQLPDECDAVEAALAQCAPIVRRAFADVLFV